MKGLGIGWNALTMVVVEGIIYLSWIGSQEILYIHKSWQHSRGTIYTALPQHGTTTINAPTPTSRSGQLNSTALQLVSTQFALNNNPNENNDDAANDPENDDQKSQSDDRTQNVNPDLQGDDTDVSSEKP